MNKEELFESKFKELSSRHEKAIDDFAKKHPKLRNCIWDVAIVVSKFTAICGPLGNGVDKFQETKELLELMLWMNQENVDFQAFMDAFKDDEKVGLA